MIPTLRTPPAQAQKAMSRIKEGFARRDKLKSKAKWADLAGSYLKDSQIAIRAGLRREGLDLLDRLAAECRASPGVEFEGMLADFKTFGTMGGLLSEVEKVRKFYGDYYQFLDHQLSRQGVVYAEDIALEPVDDPNATTRTGTNLLLVRQVVTSRVFRFGGTLVVGPGALGVAVYPQSVMIRDEGAGQEKTVSFEDVELELMTMDWQAGDFTQPAWNSQRLPGFGKISGAPEVVRIGANERLFDLIALPVEEASVTAGDIKEDLDGHGRGLYARLDHPITYTMSSDGGLKGPTNRLMEILSWFHGAFPEKQ